MAAAAHAISRGHLASPSRAPSFSVRASGRAGRPTRRGEIFEAKTVIFRFLIKNINFLLKSTQLELRKNTQTGTQKHNLLKY